MASTDPAKTDASFAALIPLGSHANAPAIDLKRPITLIGSRKDIVRIHLQSSTVSKAHCAVVLNNWGCYVHDLASRTGTLVNGQPVTDVNLNDGDTLQVGRFQFRYRAPTNSRGRRFPAPSVDLAVSTLSGPLAFDKRVIVIGRRVGSDVLFDDSRVSNLHALIFESDGRRIVRDLGSRTGSWLGGQPVHQEILPLHVDLTIGGATLTLRPRAVAAAGDDLPLTLAEAAGLAASAGPATLDAPPQGLPIDLEITVPDADAFDADTLDLAPLELEPLDLPAASPSTPGDDLAALRRGWKASRPAEPVLPSPASEIALPTPLVPVVAPPPPPVPMPEPIFVLAPALELSEIAEPPVAEVAPPVALPLPETPHVPADLVPPASEVATPTEPVVAEPIDEIERPAEPLVVDEPEMVDGAAESAELAAVERRESPKLDLESLIPPVADVIAEVQSPAEPVEPPAVVAEAPDAPDEVAAVVVDEVVPLELEPDAPAPIVFEPLELDVDALEPAAESPAAEPVAADSPAVVEEPAPAVEVAAPAAVARIELEPLDLEPFDLKSLGLPPADVAVPEAEPVADAIVDEPVAIEPAVLAPIEETESDAVAELRPDPDAPLAELLPDAADAELPAIAPADAAADLLVLDDADAETPAVIAVDDRVAEAPVEQPPIAAPPLDVAPPATDAALIALDGAAVEEEVDADATAEIEAIEITPPAVLAEPEAADEVDTSDAAVVAQDFEPLDLEPLDLESLDSEPLEPEFDPRAAEAAMNARAALEAEAETVAEPGSVAEPGPAALAETLPLDTQSPPVVADGPHVELPAFASPAAETPLPSLADDATRPLHHPFVLGEDLVEPDLVRLDEEDEDDDAEATALAVDLGLVLDEDHAEPHPADARRDDAPAPNPHFIEPASTVASSFERHEAAPPAEPVEIDLAAAQPVAPPARAAELTPAAEVFEADVVEPDPFGPPVASAPDPGIAAPSGGNLSDLMGGGPPLLGGSFLSLPPMPAADFGSLDFNASPFGAARPAAEAPQPASGDNGHADGVNGTNGRPEKRRPLRVGFGGQARPNRPAPFASERTIADAFGAADDAFATPSPSADFPAAPAAAITADTPADDGPLPEARSLPATDLLAPPERRPRGVIQPVLTGVTLAAPHVDPDALEQRAKLHRRRIRRVILCLLAMLVLIGGAVYGIYAYTPLRSSLDALITYEDLDHLGVEDATLFRRRQNDLLVSEPVRQNAVAMLPATLAQPKYYGFLSDSKRVFAALNDGDPQTRWPADQPSVMRLRVRSDDKERDLTRLRVLAQALVDASEPDRRKKTELDSQRSSDNNEVRQLRRRLGDVDDELQALKQAAENHPDPAKLAALRAEYMAAEPTLTDAKMRRQELEATVELLNRPIAAPTTAPAADPLQADAELQDFNRQLAAAQQSPTTAPNAGPQARKALDDAIARFQTDLTFAQKLRDSPELAAYVDAAGSMFTKTRDVTDNLLHSQELQQTQLTELKGHLSDMMQSGIQERLDKDPELKKLNDVLAIDIREHNAAAASGFADEAKKGELALALVRAKISERQDLLSHDQVSSAAITALQGMIEQSESRIRTDRKQVDEMLSAEQDKFVKNAGAVEKLPAEQKLLAEHLEKKLTAVADARHAYDLAADAAQSERAKAEAAANEKVAALRLQIAARRADVLAAVKARQAQDDEANRLKKLETAQTQLAMVRQDEQAAQHRVADAAMAIETAEKLRRAAVQSDAEREAKLTARASIERDLKAAQSQMELHSAQHAKLIVPDKQIAWHDYDDADRRPLFAGLAAAVIFVTLLIPVVANLLALAHEVHPPTPPSRPVPVSEGFEPVMVEDQEMKALPEPAHA